MRATKFTVEVTKNRSALTIKWRAVGKLGRLHMFPFSHQLTNVPLVRTDTATDFWTDVLNKVVPDLPNG